VTHWKRYGIFLAAFVGLSASVAGITLAHPSHGTSANSPALAAAAMAPGSWSIDALPNLTPRPILNFGQSSSKLASRGASGLLLSNKADSSHPAETVQSSQPAPSAHVVGGVIHTPSHKHATYHAFSGQAATAQSSSDLEWLARAIEAEAGAEPMDVKIAVGDVIVNRVHSPLYPNNVHDVLFQVVSGKYAFTCVQNGWIYHAPSEDSLNAAKAVLYRRENIVPDALVFYNAKNTPSSSWVRTRPVICTLGDMTFAK
jgi:spore germination cell wall hydrolase CwlJ-like protein